MKIVALSFVQRPDGAILVAWNRKHAGWALPGGKMESFETPEGAQARELYEETSLRTVSGKLVYTAEAPGKPETEIQVFSVRVIGDVIPRELGTCVGWMPKETFLKLGLWPKWNAAMFAGMSK